MEIAVIGGGAAGFFAAIHAKINHPDARVVLFEKSSKLLSKVKISGGGRCNVTNGCTDIDELCKAYPRGGRRLRKVFQDFNTTHTRAWFESREVPLYEQEDGRMFPVSDNSQSIIDCLLNEARRLGVSIKLKSQITAVQPDEKGLLLMMNSSADQSPRFHKVIVATGGSPRRKGLDWLERLGHKIEDPVPSLFTFNMPAAPITRLMGVSVEEVRVTIQGTKLSAVGPLLITHWGMSGPAILKLSAIGAKTLKTLGYTFKVQVNWVNEKNNEQVAQQLRSTAIAHPQKKLTNQRIPSVPRKLWLHLLEKCEVSLDTTWGEAGKKTINKLVNVLTNDVYQVQDKTTFKEEFVTCGGVSLQSVDMKTMQSKVCENLYFAGEILDIDGITGGYNFQAAWTTGFIAGKLH